MITVLVGHLPGIEVETAVAVEVSSRGGTDYGIGQPAMIVDFDASRTVIPNAPATCLAFVVMG